MFKKDDSPKCALIMAPCPKTANETATLYCPHWVENIPEVEKDGTGRITAEVFYTGCQLRRQVLYLLSVTASAGQAAKSADEARADTYRMRETMNKLQILVISTENGIGHNGSLVEAQEANSNVSLLGR